jgi:hypothetical protein
MIIVILSLILQEFVGNLYVNSTNTVVFDDAVFARCVRVVPTRRVGDDTSMRFELLGCGKTCILSNTLKFKTTFCQLFANCLFVSCRKHILEKNQ